MTTGEAERDQVWERWRAFAADQIRAAHVPGDLGFCDYCLTQHGHLINHPCPQAQWAVADAAGGDDGRQ